MYAVGSYVLQFQSWENQDLREEWRQSRHDHRLPHQVEYSIIISIVMGEACLQRFDGETTQLKRGKM